MRLCGESEMNSSFPVPIRDDRLRQIPSILRRWPNNSCYPAIAFGRKKGEGRWIEVVGSRREGQKILDRVNQLNLIMGKTSISHRNEES
jgi:hypothetical protein